MDNDNSRNTVIFFVCFVVIMVVYQVLVLGPASKRHEAALHASQAAAAAQHQAGGGPSPASLGILPTPQAVTASPTVQIDTPSLAGRITLRGARIDQLYLKGYHTTIDPNSPLVQLLRPEGVPHAWFIQTGWVSKDVQDLPNLDAIQWTAPAGAELTPT